MPAIHNKSEQMYIIYDPHRKGFLTWDFDGKRHIMAFTESDGAEQYNEAVLDHRSGEIRIIKRRESLDFARRMVKLGVNWMIIDFPVENDQVEVWNPIPLEITRDYGLVNLKLLVRQS